MKLLDGMSILNLNVERQKRDIPKMHSYRLCQNVCHLQLMPLLSMIFGFDIEHNIKFSIQLSKWSENKQDGKFLGI